MEDFIVKIHAQANTEYLLSLGLVLVVLGVFYFVFFT